jgi:hypothetical protein
VNVLGIASSLALPAAIFFACTAQATEIRQFDRMNPDDQDRYVADLIIGAEEVLRNTGQAGKAAEVGRLFSEVKPGDTNSLGMVEFEVNLARARLAAARRLDKDPNAKRLEVEDAMAGTLEKNGIEVPDAFFAVLADFRPKYPLKP